MMILLIRFEPISKLSGVNGIYFIITTEKLYLSLWYIFFQNMPFILNLISFNSLSFYIIYFLLFRIEYWHVNLKIVVLFLGNEFIVDKCSVNKSHFIYFSRKQVIRLFKQHCWYPLQGYKFHFNQAVRDCE